MTLAIYQSQTVKTKVLFLPVFLSDQFNLGGGGGGEEYGIFGNHIKMVCFRSDLQFCVTALK